MNCKVCGTRLGILERWRYGDFCSEEHKTVFAEDLKQLDRRLAGEPEAAAPQRAASARPVPPAPAAAKPAVEESATPEEPAPEPEPAMAGFLKQEEARPCKPQRRTEAKAKPAVDKPEKPSGLWKVMAKLAEQDAAPAALRANRGEPKAPVILIAAPQEPGIGPGGYYMTGTHPAYCPPTQMSSAVRGLPQCEMTRVAENFWGPALAVPMPFVPAQPRHWVDQQGWHWIADLSSQVVPTVENVLAAYPMMAPWTHWPIMAPSAQPQPQAPGPAGVPGQMQAGYAPPPGAGPVPVPPGVAPQGLAAGGGLPRIPAAAYSGGMAGLAMPMGAAPLSPGGGSPGVAGGLFGGGPMMGWGMSPFGQTGPMSAGGPGLLWREIPPPLFNALVDISFGMQGMRISGCLLEPVIGPAAWPVEAPRRPQRRQMLQVGLRACGMLTVSTTALAQPLPPVRDYAAGPEMAVWSPALPPMPALPRPRVPRRVAPPVILPLGSRLGLPKPAEPLMATGAGLYGARGG